MKKKSIIYFLVACLGFGMVSCEDMLTADSDRHSYKVGQDTLYSYWGILKSLQNVAERYVILGECRGELVSGTGYLSDTIQSILDFDMDKATDGSCRYLRASDYYHIVNSCNAYLAQYDSLRLTGTLQPYMKKEAAQVEAIRAWVYLQLVQVYGKVPFYTKPLLTTDAINAFAASHPLATPDNLADLLGPSLEQAAVVEMTYGFPQYQSYGRTATVAHSSKLMIPINLVLGDLYLMKGDASSCAKAAQYYHNYLSGNLGQSAVEEGGILPNGYNYSGYKGDNATQTRYIMWGSYVPWQETGAQARERESVTAIASSTNKLWGTVLRGVNEVFGYSSQISVRTNEKDTVTTALVLLVPTYNKKQLAASPSYFDLCKAQQFEMYVGVSSTLSTLTVDPSVGDARQYWVKDVFQTYANGVTNTEKFVTKQNPYGVFTTTYPVIYRKAQIWLRYAEALCGAGYPSYAFAILKDGLCNNATWLPKAGTADYAVKDSAYVCTYMGTDKLLHDYPAADAAVIYPTRADLLAAVAAAGIHADSVKSVSYTAVTYENYPDAATTAALNYIDQRETLKGGAYINFDHTAFRGITTTPMLFLRSTLSVDDFMMMSDQSSQSNYAVGIHSRGNGILKYSDRHNSAYNYVDMVAQKAKENYGVTLTKADIYSGSHDDVVRKCVEDLIIDEAALELAFEGNRFFDLMRVARRRNDPSYLANKLGQRNSALKTKLLNEQNWYFPLPQ